MLKIGDMYVSHWNQVLWHILTLHKESFMYDVYYQSEGGEWRLHTSCTFHLYSTLAERVSNDRLMLTNNFTLHNNKIISKDDILTQIEKELLL